jgi:hypothetical protein
MSSKVISISSALETHVLAMQSHEIISRRFKMFLCSYVDNGFAAYVSYIHIEVAHTNPIMLGQLTDLQD